ncbi:hypothetical protein PMAYCL1PPCAC_07005, partial [Pristionchus mayeri]
SLLLLLPSLLHLPHLSFCFECISSASTFISRVSPPLPPPPPHLSGIFHKSSLPEMERFISLKTAVSDLEEAEGRLFELTDSLGTQFEQVDTYFNSNYGTLKMRNMPPSPEGQLISTSLISSEGGQRLIQNMTTVIDDVESLRETLGVSLGERGTVSKSRRVFLLPDARIYLDDVKGIGRYLEILVAILPLSPGKNESGEDLARRRTYEIAAALNISKDSSVAKSYIELLCPLDRQAQRS